MRLHPDNDCNRCFVKDCSCECNTCVNARDRNNILEQEELDKLNFADALKVKRDGEKN